MNGLSVNKCPFCGDDEPDVDHDNDAQKWRVLCGNCGASGPTHENRNSCIELWNCRPQELAMLINSAHIERERKERAK